MRPGTPPPDENTDWSEIGYAVRKKVMRPLEYDLTPFVGPVERVRVMALNRAYGFTLAALQASDPNNIWKVRLVKDVDHYLDRKNVEDRIVQDGYQSSFTSGAQYDRSAVGRAYNADFTLFGLAGSGGSIVGVGRANVFTATAIEVDPSPDNVVEVRINMVSNLRLLDSGEEYYDYGDEWDLQYFKQNRKYGGVTIDLKDEVEPWISLLHQ